MMLTYKGFYRQQDGLAMGSPPAPYLANGWLSMYDDRIKDDAKVFARYMDDILRDIKSARIDDKLDEINAYHPNLNPFLSDGISESRFFQIKNWNIF